jgi:uncharacterized protein (TIGR01777 family)
MDKLHIAIAGGTGMIGQALMPKLEILGHRVSILSRRRSQLPGIVQWDPSKLWIDTDERFDAIINLAGVGIMQNRWTQSYKKQILESRVQAVDTLDSYILKTGASPLLINASAIGLYGNDYDRTFKEVDDGPANDFLSSVCHRWEQAVHVMKSNTTRYILRIGVVMSREGGALPQMNPFGKLGLTPTLGKGRQYVSWIHVEDLIGIIMFLISSRPPQGIYNAVAPHPISYGDLARSIAKRSIVKWSPRIPSAVLRLVLGERADMVLNSTKVSSQKIQDAGYHFRFSEIENAIEDLL